MSALIPEAVATLVERLTKRADEDRSCAENGEVIVALLQPQMDLFDKREGGWNTYAVRMWVDHRNSARKDRQRVADLEAVIALLQSDPQP